MVKKGDRVRFLNATGGGIVTKTEGNLAYVQDEDGFDTPVMIRELVVVLPAGHVSDTPGGAKVMFDQSAFDKGRSEREEIKPAPAPVQPAEQNPLPAVETPEGDSISLSLAFEPTDLNNLGVSKFSAVLVNDSNYYLDFVYLTSEGNGHWSVTFRGTAGPNELLDLAQYTHEDLSEIDSIGVQYIAYKQGKEFRIKAPGSVIIRPDLTKFYKLHCFRPGRYFDTPVIEIPVLERDEPLRKQTVKTISLEETMKPDAESVRQLKEKYRVDTSRKPKGEKKNNSVSPTKLLPLVEVDLHIHELTDTTTGMSAGDMLEMQLDAVRRTMGEHKRRIGQKIVFIHGKGDGVLRKSVLSLLKKEYPKCETQDASFREYGFGATLVTVK